MSSNTVHVWDGGSGSISDTYDFIYGQGNVPYGNMKYGISSVGFSGCEAVAIYNALILIDKPVSFEVIRNNMLFSISKGGGYGMAGLFGGDQGDIMNTLNALRVNYVHASYEQLNALDSDTVMIIGYWSSMSFSLGFSVRNKEVFINIPSIHTVAVHYTNGEYIIYNPFNNSQDVSRLSSLRELLTEGRKYIYGFILQP